MPDVGDEVPTRRASHFNSQRSYRSSLPPSLPPSLPSPSLPPHSLPSHSPPIRARTQTDLPRLDDFDLTDSAPPPSPSSAASPAPNVPYTRSRGTSDAKRDAKRARRSAGRRTSHSTLASQAELGEGPGRAIEHLLPLHDWHPRPSSTPRPTDSEVEQARRARRPSLPRRDTLGQTSVSQLSITALPTMGDDKEGPAWYHASKASPQAQRVSAAATTLYTLSYLVFFAIWGTLARLGLQALTFYPGAPVVFSELWANVAGTFVIGFLAEDRRLFRSEWRNGGASVPARLERAAAEPHEAKARHGRAKKTIPLYVGLVTGFCGSFTSFSSFIRDMFLSLSNDLRSPISHPYPATSTAVSRSGGYSVMAVCATTFLTIASCYSALHLGSHLALLLDPFTPTLPFRLSRRFLDPLFVLLGWGTWLGAVLLAVFPPHEAWRGQALFACVFAPLGCLTRYYLSLWLNPWSPSFPLGTFAANLFGTAVLAMAFDLQHVSLSTTGMAAGSVMGCQVLQGIQDGLCGALTTVSTWMSELDGLERRHGYVYGTVSVGSALALLVAIMGSVRWTVGWDAITCVT